MKKLFNYMVVGRSEKKMDGFHCIGSKDWRKCYDYDISKTDANNLILEVFKTVTGIEVNSWNEALKHNIEGVLTVYPTYNPRRGDTSGYSRGFEYKGVWYIASEYWYGDDSNAERYARRCYRLDGKKKNVA